MIRLLVLLLLLGGCASKPLPPPGPVVVYRSPLAGKAVPVAPAPLPPRPQSLSAAADVLLAQVCKLSAFVVQAVPLLALSKGEAPGTPLSYPECDR